MKHICGPDHKHAETGTCFAKHKCRCLPCCQRENDRVASAYRFERRIKNMNRRVPALGVARRLQALACLGWSCKELSDRTGIDLMHVNQMRRLVRPTVLLSTHTRVDEVYRDLSERRNPARSAGHSIKHAERCGWAPPYAWDDIDNPAERPKGVAA